jgi:hypothetical protein
MNDVIGLEAPKKSEKFSKNRFLVSFKNIGKLEYIILNSIPMNAFIFLD